MLKFKVILNTGLYFIGFIILFLIFIKIRNEFLVYNNTNSEPVGYYVTLPIDTVQKGNLYIITIPDAYMQIIKKLGYHANGTLLKQVIAVKGDIIDINKVGILVNHKLQTNTKSQQSSRGVNLFPQLIGYHHKLLPGEFWVLGNTPDSFDSRYFGIITFKQVKKRAIFLFHGLHF